MTGAWLEMSRFYGRKLGGERLEEMALKRKTGKLSLIAAVSSQGLDKQRCLILEDNVDGKAFLTYTLAGSCAYSKEGAAGHDGQR